MPGSIRVSVLEAFDLPEAIADGEDVVIKVAVGTREFQTASNKAVGGKTAPWSLDFVFPVLNLRDNLVVMLLDENGEIISKNEIDTPSIVEKGSFEVDLSLNGGGNIHLSLGFVLTDEERRRIDIMRAAALKRREQEALKSIATTQPVEKESESRPSESHSAPVGNPGNDMQEHKENEDSPSTVSQESDEPQSNKSEEILQGTQQESLMGLEPVEELELTGQDISEKTTAGESISPQDPLEIRQSDADQIKPNPFSTGETPSQACISSELEEQTTSENSGESLENSLEVNNMKPSPSSVKAKIKAFETTRRKGAMKQGHILPSSVEVHMSSPQSNRSPKRNGQTEAEQVALAKEHLDHIDAGRTEDEKLDPANQMESAEMFKSFAENSVAASRVSEAEHYENENECLDEREDKGQESILEPVESNERYTQREKTLVTASTQKRRNINLMSVSKQFLSGAIIGAIGGAILIAAGTLFWATNSKYRRTTSARQKSKQETRK